MELKRTVGLFRFELLGQNFVYISPVQRDLVDRRNHDWQRHLCLTYWPPGQVQKRFAALQKLQYCYNIQQDGLGGDVSDSLGGLRLCVDVGCPCLRRAGHHDSQVPSTNQHLCKKSSPSVLGQSTPTSWRLSVPSLLTCSAGSPP